MKTLIGGILILVFLSACAKREAQQSANVSSIVGTCQLQSSQPAPQYGIGAEINTYYCNQFRPACFYKIIQGVPALDQVPAIIETTCNSIPAIGQVPL